MEETKILPRRRHKTKRSTGGRPAIDWTVLQNEVRGLALIQCTFDEAALCLGVDRDTFSAALRKHVWLNNIWEEGRAKGCASLRRTQWKIATQDKSVSMCIWLGKQYLGQKEPARDAAELAALQPSTQVVFLPLNGRDDPRLIIEGKLHPPPEESPTQCNDDE